jgi:hypothetical protein
MRRDLAGRGKVVMDLSDPHFRKTFAHNLREKEEQCGQTVQAGQGGQNGNGPTGYGQSRRGRFEYYKYRRLLLNNEGEEAP